RLPTLRCQRESHSPRESRVSSGEHLACPLVVAPDDWRNLAQRVRRCPFRAAPAPRRIRRLGRRTKRRPQRLLRPPLSPGLRLLRKAPPKSPSRSKFKTTIYHSPITIHVSSLRALPPPLYP